LSYAGISRGRNIVGPEASDNTEFTQCFHPFLSRFLMGLFAFANAQFAWRMRKYRVFIITPLWLFYRLSVAIIPMIA